jgi:ferritin-like metal-binding protein YciE
MAALNSAGLPAKAHRKRGASTAYPETEKNPHFPCKAFIHFGNMCSERQLVAEMAPADHPALAAIQTTFAACRPSENTYSAVASRLPRESPDPCQLIAGGTEGQTIMDSAREMFMHQLADMRDAEMKLAAALRKIQRRISNETLSHAMQQHRIQTEEHARRIDEVFADLDVKPRRQPCRGMLGLIEEFQSFAKNARPDKELLDVYATGASIKIEHYEISAYESLIAIAEKLGLEEAASRLSWNLQDEREQLSKLQELGQDLLAHLPDEEEEAEEEAAASPKRHRGK